MRTILLFSLGLFLATSALAQQKVEWPEITQQNKPWTRWWWMGSAVNEADLTRSMELYKDAGLGGMEITAIYGVKGEESKFIDYLSPRWIEVFEHTLSEAGRLDLGIDLANASGWPFGGPWVTQEDACKTLEIKTYSLKSGESLKEPVEFVQKPLLRLASTYKPDWSELKEPISNTPNLQQKALDQVRFEKKLPLIAVMAYSNNGESLDLTSKVANDGKLNWQAPEGEWEVFALFQGLHGKMVERAGPGGEGDVIDHFSKKATDNYLSYFDEKFEGVDLTNLRGYFNDSYEVDDARGEANWTPNFFLEFKQRRGYDLKEYLPLLFSEEHYDSARRVLCDYRETISDLLLESYTKPWHKWAADQGKIIRNQAHGSPANILDLYAATDIPEVEGEHIPSIKFASSAAHVTGKQLTASESATWLNQHFKSNLGDAKHALDLLMLGGVNHIFYHGTSYSPQEAVWPGWLFYAAVHFNPQNPFWDDFSALNNYVTRCQSFLQQGLPDNDVLLYFPIYDQWSRQGRSMLQHFNGYRRLPENWTVKLLAEEMVEKGYSYDYISDKQILNLKVDNGAIASGDMKYKTILVPSSQFIPAATLKKLLDLAIDGATVLFQDMIPKKFAGFGDIGQQRDYYKYLMEDIIYHPDNSDSLIIASKGSGKIIIAKGLNNLMEATDVKRETMTDKYLQCIRRKIGDNYFYFITNHGEEELDGKICLAHKFDNAALLNPMTGKTGVIPVFEPSKKGTEVYLQLSAGETCLLLASNKSFEGEEWSYLTTGAKSKELKGKWTISFIKGGPTLPKQVTIKNLSSWTEFGDDELQNFSGTGKYQLIFSNPKLSTDKLKLDLGSVYESATVYLNGKLVAKLIGPDYSVAIDNKDLKEENELVVEVANGMGNRIAYMDRNGIKWRNYYNTNFQSRVVEDRGEDGWFSAAKWLPVASGLLGPVQLVELEEVRP